MKKFFRKVLYTKASLLACAVILFTSCTRLPYSRSPSVQAGLASWYGLDFHGKKTSGGEKYNMYELTAAHRTLPFGTYVMVTNERNEKSVKVIVNDRGPFIEGRIIDLSYAAAKAIDMVGPGVIPVRVEVLSDIPVSKLNPSFCVQVGSFISKEKAVDLRRQLGRHYNKVYIEDYKTRNQTYYRVRINTQNYPSAQRLSKKLQSEGYVAMPLER